MQLLLLWGCLVLPGYGALVGPKEISGFEGDTVSLQCSYGEELRARRKYWCKRGGLLIPRCSGTTVYAGQDSRETTEGRVSIRDSPQELRLTVTLRNLTLQDAGTYWCGVIKLGPDETHLVSLLVFPAFPGFHPRVTTAKQGKTEAKASPSTGASLSVHAGISLHTGTSPAGTSPDVGTSPDAATSPHAGVTYPATQLHSTLAKGTGPSRSSSKPRVSVPVIRILAPILVLLALLLATVLAALGSHLLRRRKEVQLAAGTEKKEKVDFSCLPPENRWVPEHAVVNLARTAAPTGPQVSPEPPANPGTDQIHGLSQTSEEGEAPRQDPQGTGSRSRPPPTCVGTSCASPSPPRSSPGARSRCSCPAIHPAPGPSAPSPARAALPPAPLSQTRKCLSPLEPGRGRPTAPPEAAQSAGRAAPGARLQFVPSQESPGS